MKFVSVANDGIVRNNTGFHTIPGFKTPVKLTILVCQTRSYNPSWPSRTFFATERVPRASESFQKRRCATYEEMEEGPPTPPDRGRR